MKTTAMEPREIPVGEIKVFIDRAREKDGYEQMRDAMADPEVGLKIPIQVRDFGRRNKDGFRYELIAGQGRLCAALDLKWKTIPALIVSAEEVEIAGRFLAENMLRKPLAWAEKGRMIREAMQRGVSIENVARKFHITVSHAQKCIRVLNKVAPGLEEEVSEMPMNEAEVFTTLPESGQKIVIEVAKKTGASVREITTKAKELDEQGAWTKTELVKKLRSLDENLAAAQKRAKLLRLHAAIGPINLQTLLQNPKLRTALRKEGVNFDTFQEVMK